MRRIINERRKHTADFGDRHEHLCVCPGDPEVCPGDCHRRVHKHLPDEVEEEEEDDVPMRMVKHHKGSIAKPLDGDSEDALSYRRYSAEKIEFHDGLSRFIGDKRSTIKEQTEDEEEFTGSSIHVSGNLQMLRSSNLMNKRESRSTVGGGMEDSEPHTKNSKRKYSDPNFGSGCSPSMKVNESKPRKFTEDKNDFKMIK